MITKEQLEDYKLLLDEQKRVNDAVAKSKAALQADSGEKDDVMAMGLRARWKPGRKKIDHKSAADGVDTAPFTVQAPPVFVIEEAK